MSAIDGSVRHAGGQARDAQHRDNPLNGIAVIGAGWAGLAAAARLQRAGRAVRVYEAAAAPGGSR